MAAAPKLLSCDGYLLKQLALSGLEWLDTNQEKVNQLNVFPVPDGDTGTNMYLTMRKACEPLVGMDEAHVGKVCKTIAAGALLGARGNSGVILSQWWRGLAEALENHAQFDAPIFALACQNAVERAYKAVVKPVEGTILTVTRQAMEAVVEKARTERDLNRLIDVKVDAAYNALKQTPDLLPVLKDAGVVDSGGQGWTYIIEGMLKQVKGEALQLSPLETVMPAKQPVWQEALVPEDEEGYGYDVQFLMRGQGMDVDAIRAAIDAIGWSTLVVGDANLIKVHVHVHDPGVPISYAIKQGAALDDVVVENMQAQYQDYVVEREKRETEDDIHPVEGVAVITVAPSDALKTMFTRDLGATYAIGGGQTMNPSTEDFLRAIQKVPNTEIILLPNNPNILLAAKQASELVSGKQVKVVPSRTLPQGIAAMFEYGNEREDSDLMALAEGMQDAMSNVVTCEITTATRTVSLEGVAAREGQYIGLIDDKLRAAGDRLQQVAEDVLAKANADKSDLITLYYGEAVTESDAQQLIASLSARFTKPEFQTVNGGQPLYPYIISVE
ncbi:MAG: DAK2 domain-containing protein [Chloroflexi bacterium]|nr:DAK2 domain-containing protein [Chloroflexota bacterium]